MSSNPKAVILTEADPTVTRIIPSMAVEIGFNEHVMLLQISHWIKISNNFKDGQWWTFQSTRDMRKKAFPYWSVATINRISKSLVDKKLLNTGNYNQKKYDKTCWYALNVEEISKLKSVHVGYVDEDGNKLSQNETRSNHFETRSNQNETHSAQNVTTIPEITTEITTETTTKESNAPLPPAGAFDEFVETLPLDDAPRPKPPISDEMAAKLLINTFLKATRSADVKMLDSRDRKREASILYDDGMRPFHIETFIKRLKAEEFWREKNVTWPYLIKNIISHFEARPPVTVVFEPEVPIKPVIIAPSSDPADQFTEKEFDAMLEATSKAMDF